MAVRGPEHPQPEGEPQTWLDVSLRLTPVENKTAPVEGKAVASLKNVKAGEKYTLTCRDNEAGEHQAVVAIMKTPPAKATAAKKSSKKY